MSTCAFPGECRASRACYVNGGCRGSACAEARRDYDRERKRSRKRPDVVAAPARVGTGQVCSHIEMLRAAGLGLGRIAALAGLRENTVWLIATGRQSTVTLDTREALLAVMPSMVAPSVLVDAEPVVEQVEMLLEAGWSEIELAGLLFRRRRSVDLRKLLGRAKVTQRVADTVAVLAREEFPPEPEPGDDPLAEWALLVSDSAWRAQAECRRLDADVRKRQAPFFPTRGDPPILAKETCERCPVKLPCLEFALATNEKQGIWGGTTGGDRRLIRRLGWTAEDVIAAQSETPRVFLIDLLHAHLDEADAAAV